MAEPAERPDKKAPRARSVSRLSAVQALFQLAMSDNASGDAVVDEFRSFRFGSEIEGETYGRADDAFFSDIVKSAWDNRTDIDGHIETALSEDWSIARLDPLLHAILRAGIYELTARIDVPHAVIIDEYLDIAGAFYDRQEKAFVNGLLDKVSKTVRPES